MATGTVSRLWRWPVKSMAGEEVRALGLGARGAAGDRRHAVLHEHKGAWRPLTAREAPGLLAWSAGLDPAEPSTAIVTGPDGRRRRWEEPELRPALEADLGRPVELLREPAGVHDVPGTLLVTVAATVQALDRELGANLDLRRFRPNLHLELDAEPWAEEGWQGAEACFAGGVRLRLLELCDRCAIPTRDPDTREKWPQLLRHLAARHGQNLGIRAQVVQGGSVAAGEEVRISSGSGRSGR